MRTIIYSEKQRRLHIFLRNMVQSKSVYLWNIKRPKTDSAVLDSLTGIYNRFGINLYLQELHPQVGIDYAIILLNLDNFKKIQHEFGLNYADTALIQVATILCKNLRDTDIVGRYGQHEFVIILSNTNLEKAKRVTQRLAKLIQAKAITLKTQSILLQASCGVSSSAPQALSNQVLEQADQALCMAKSYGFNQIQERNAEL